MPILELMVVFLSSVQCSLSQHSPKSIKAEVTAVHGTNVPTGPATFYISVDILQTQDRGQIKHSHKARFSPYHIPDKVGKPVDHRLHTTDELQVLSLADTFLDEEDHKAGRNKGHGKDHTDGD